MTEIEIKRALENGQKIFAPAFAEDGFCRTGATVWEDKGYYFKENSGIYQNISFIDLIFLMRDFASLAEWEVV